MKELGRMGCAARREEKETRSSNLGVAEVTALAVRDELANIGLRRNPARQRRGSLSEQRELALVLTIVNPITLRRAGLLEKATGKSEALTCCTRAFFTPQQSSSWP
jgi:hypothetical protein